MDPLVVEAQAAVMESPPVAAILAAQKPGGWWGEEGNMYLPKYRATTHSLLILAELGAERTPGVDGGMEHIFRFQRESGHFLMDLPRTEKGRASTVKDGVCLDANVLFYALYFGYLDDPRVQRLLDFTVSYHDPESGGWRCRSYPLDPAAVYPRHCYMGAIKMLRSLSRVPFGKRSPALRRLIDREVEKTLENGVYRYLRNKDGTRKDKAGWKKFGFPLFYQSDALEALDALISLGVRDPRMEPAVKLVEDARQPDGRWLLENTYNGKMIVDIEEKGKPSKWVTLRALRSLRHLGL